MVFYTCSGCGESLKKNKVDNHVYSCRSCEYLTCMDCSKDFYGDDYKTHTSCISEDQKYAAKGTEFKPNKGDVKQQQWLQQIEAAMKSDISLSKGARNLLQNLKSYDNIPRKRSKFLNFIKNSLRIYDSKLGEEVWEALSSASKPRENGVTSIVSSGEKNGEKAEKIEIEDVQSEHLKEKKKAKKRKKESSEMGATDTKDPSNIKKQKLETDEVKNTSDECVKDRKKKSKKRKKAENEENQVSLKRDESNHEQTETNSENGNPVILERKMKSKKKNKTENKQQIEDVLDGKDPGDAEICAKKENSEILKVKKKKLKKKAQKDMNMDVLLGNNKRESEENGTHEVSENKKSKKHKKKRKEKSDVVNTAVSNQENITESPEHDLIESKQREKKQKKEKNLQEEECLVKPKKKKKQRKTTLNQEV